MDSRAIEVPRALIDTMPPERFAESCPDGDFGCEHWAHGTGMEGRYIFSGEMVEFLDSKVKERGL